jgi:lysozyme family protein
MKANYERALPLFLKHEGGFVNHPKDPGGATNKGVTIGTLKRLKIDVDGDGDSDITDLRNLRHEDVARVYKLFYWDAVKGDLLPAGLDYAVADFGINSGPARAAKHLQKVVGVTQDGDIGPKTLAAVAARDPQDIINALCDSRLRFLKALKTWGTFGKGWNRRVAEVRAVGLAWAENGPPLVLKPAPAAPRLEPAAPPVIPGKRKDIPAQTSKPILGWLLPAVLGVWAAVLTWGREWLDWLSGLNPFN